MASVQRMPRLRSALRRIDVPDHLEAVTSIGQEEDPELYGLSRATLERIWMAAQELYRSGVHPALQLCLRRHGHIVLDRAIGHARGNGPLDAPETPKVPVTPQTPYCVFSTSKAMTAMVIHLLHERGALDISDRVAEHIPGYARYGKGDTTIGHVLAHRAGVPTLPRELLEVDKLADRELVCRVICEAEPQLKPGKLLAYHAISGGVILGEIVHRVAGKSIRDVLAQEILDPLRFRWGNYGVVAEDVAQVGLNYATGVKLLPPFSNLAARVLSRPVDEVVELSNQTGFLTAVIPSGNIVTTANELSRFFEILRAGGEIDGVRIMQPATIRRALTEQSRLEFDLSLGFPTRFSYGLMLGAKVLSPYGRDTDLAFGHLGFINIMGWADPERGISGGLTNSGKAIVYPELARFYALMQRIASEVPKVPAPERRL
jgi:CubicO group peptidase (beta-lactamase class C family)